MALNFDTYLFASSPVELQLPTRFFRRRWSRDLSDVDAAAHPPVVGSDLKTYLVPVETEHGASENYKEQSNAVNHGDFEDDIGGLETFDGLGITKCQDRSADAERIRKWQLAYDCDLDLCVCSAEKNRKKSCKVTFVDDEKLAEVHIVHESSDDPPSLRRFRSSSSNTSAFVSTISLKINFDQPIANYLLFYRRLSEINVSLENIIVASNLQLVGTIKTKNIASKKSVVIRFTFDHWNSYTDMEAKCILNNQTSCQYDTYEFRVCVPPSITPVTPSPVQFAICYNADNQQFWDNNEQQNYQVDVVTITERKLLENCGETKQSNSWCESVMWSDAEVASPYW